MKYLRIIVPILFVAIGVTYGVKLVPLSQAFSQPSGESSMTLEEERDIIQGHFFKYDLNIYQPGGRLKAFVVCYNNFLGIEDLSDEAKDITKYVIAISEEPDQFRIMFIPNYRVVTESYSNSASMREMHYLVDTKTFEIKRASFGK